MNRAKGIALVILSAVIFGITPTMAKYTYTHGSNPVMMTMFRSLLPIPIILAVLLIKKIPIKIGENQRHCTDWFNGNFCNA